MVNSGRRSENPFSSSTVSEVSTKADEGSRDDTGRFFRVGFFIRVYWNAIVASFAVFVYILPWITRVDAGESFDTFRLLAGFSTLGMLVLLLNGLLAFCQLLIAGFRIAAESRTAVHHFLAACWTAICIAIWIVAVGNGCLLTM